MRSKYMESLLMVKPAANIIIRLLDIIAIKFKCCEKYYPCYQCHEETADHPAQIWNKDEWNIKAILCGVCKTELTINDYMRSGNFVRIVKPLSIQIAVNTIICTSRSSSMDSCRTRVPFASIRVNCATKANSSMKFGL